jgi:hypothetical protein
MYKEPRTVSSDNIHTMLTRSKGPVPSPAKQGTLDTEYSDPDLEDHTLLVNNDILTEANNLMDLQGEGDSFIEGLTRNSTYQTAIHRTPSPDWEEDQENLADETRGSDVYKRELEDFTPLPPPLRPNDEDFDEVLNKWFPPQH